MPSLDTSNWLESGQIWQQTTGDINAWATNGTNQWTLMETAPRYTAGSNREWGCGFSLVNANGDTNGQGKSVRPPQRLTLQLTGGGHTHFVPDLSFIQVYGAVQEGSSGIPTPTGVIGLGIETYRTGNASQLQPTAPTANDAQLEIDVVIYDASETNRYASLDNYTLSTTGLGTAFDESIPNSITWRGALGTTDWDRTFLFHNSQSNAWTFGGGWSLTGLWNTTRLAVAYRIHSPVQPYYLGNTVPYVNPPSAIEQQGIYSAHTPVNHIVRPSGSAHAGASPVVQQTDHIENIRAYPHGEASTSSSVMYQVSRAHRIAIEGIARTGMRITTTTHARATAMAMTAYTVLLRHAGRVIGNAEGEVRPSYEIVIRHNGEETVDGPAGQGGGDGFLQTAGRRLWRMLGLR